MASGVPLEAVSPTEARLMMRLLRDLVTRLVPQPAGAVLLVGAETVQGNLVVAGDAAVTGALSAGGTGSVTGLLAALGGLNVTGALHPATPSGAAQTAGALYVVTGAPSNANGSNGDFAFRTDGGVGTTFYVKAGGAWVGRA